MLALQSPLTQQIKKVQLLHEDASSSEFYEIFIGNVSRRSLYSGLRMRLHVPFFVLAALVFIILRALHCSLSSSKVSLPGPRQRMLAGGNEGAGQEDDDTTDSGSCWNIEELLAPQAEAGPSGVPLPSAQAGASAQDEAADGETQPRKRKRKMKIYLEDSPEKQAKAARMSSAETLQSTGELPNPFEGSSASPPSEAHFSSSYSTDLSTDGTEVMYDPFSQPFGGTFSEDLWSSGSSDEDGTLQAPQEKLSDEAVIEGMLDAENLNLEDWFYDPFAALPLFTEQEDDSSQVPSDPQPSTSTYDIPMPVPHKETQQLLFEAAAHQQEQRQSASPSPPLEGTSTNFIIVQQPYSLLLVTHPWTVVQVAPSTSSAVLSAPPSSYSSPPQTSPSSHSSVSKTPPASHSPTPQTPPSSHSPPPQTLPSSYSSMSQIQLLWHSYASRIPPSSHSPPPQTSPSSHSPMSQIPLLWHSYASSKTASPRSSSSQTPPSSPSSPSQTPTSSYSSSSQTPPLSPSSSSQTPPSSHSSPSQTPPSSHSPTSQIPLLWHSYASWNPPPSHSSPPQTPPSSHSSPSQKRQSPKATPSTSGYSAASAPPPEHSVVRRLPKGITIEQCMAHPFYALPTTETGGNLRPFNRDRAVYPVKKSLTSAVLPVAAILRKKHLTTQDLQRLIDEGEGLYSYATKYLNKSIKMIKPTHILASWARRFLVVHYLWCVCEVVGPAMRREEWWDGLLSAVVGEPPRGYTDLYKTITAQLLQRMFQALEEFRQGRRPSAELLVPILQHLFDSQTGILILRASEWDPWRQDDRQYLESLRRQEEESGDRS